MGLRTKPKRRRWRVLRILVPLALLALLVGYPAVNGWLPGWGGTGRDFAASLTGRVVTARGHQPVAGATVTVGKVRATTDATGTFELRHADLLNRSVRIHVKKGGFESHAFTTRIDLPEINLGLIRLARAYYLTGKVVSRDLQAPVPAARVTVVRPASDGGPLVVETDAAGRYRVGPVLESARFTLRIEHPAYLPVSHAGQTIASEADNRPATVYLSVGGVISGMARADRRHGVNGAWIMVYRVNRNGSRGALEKAELSEADGTFLIQGLFPGPKEIVGEIPDSDRTALPVKVTVPEAGEVTGVQVIFSAR